MFCEIKPDKILVLEIHKSKIGDFYLIMRFKEIVAYYILILLWGIRYTQQQQQKIAR